MPAPTEPTADDYHLVRGYLNHHYSVDDVLVAGLGIEYNTSTGDSHMMVAYGGALGVTSYEKYDRELIDNVPTLVTCTYEMGGWNTSGRVVFPGIKNFYSNEGVDWFISNEYIVLFGTVVFQDDSELFGLHYYRYQGGQPGRTEGTLSFKEVPWELPDQPIDMTLAGELVLYVVREDRGEGEQNYIMSILLD